MLFSQFFDMQKDDDLFSIQHAKDRKKKQQS